MSAGPFALDGESGFPYEGRSRPLRGSSMAAVLRRSLLLACLAAAPPAGAGELTDYAVVRAGVYLPQARASAYSTGSYGTGQDFELAVGRVFQPGFVGEIGVGYLQAESDVTQDSYPGDPLSHPMKSSFSLVPITASVKFVLAGGSIEPYAFGGAGVYLARFRKAPTDGLPAVSDRSTTFGYHVGAGASFRAGERALLGLDGRYNFCRDEYFGNRYSFNGIGFTATVAYRF